MMPGREATARCNAARTADHAKTITERHTPTWQRKLCHICKACSSGINSSA